MFRSNVAIRRAFASTLFFALLLMLTPSSLFAFPIYDTFGPLDVATFGGQGIPNQEVAVSKQFVHGNVQITVAMSATQRFTNPPLTNDGAGTYFAQAGSNFGGNGESTTEAALWNFNGYIAVEGLNGATPLLTDYQFDVYYDFDPGFDTPIGQLGKGNLSALIALEDPGATVGQESQNLMFDFLAVSVPGLLTPPAGSFDPNALGEYNFILTVSQAGIPLETVAMDVQVVPEPAACILALLGMAALFLTRLRRATRAS